MAVSSSFDFIITRDDIITEALEICGSISVGETPDSNTVTSCARTLNMLVKAWQADGMQLYRRKTYSITLVASDKDYVFGSGGTVTEVPTKLIDAYTRDTNNIDTPIELISAQEYTSLSNKSTTGPVVSAYYEYLGTTATLYVWPAPASGVTDTLYVVGSRPVYDLDASSDDIDIPNYYFLALSYGLADAISLKRGVDSITANDISLKAMKYKMEALNYDTEQGTSVYIQPRRG